jgi:hypothetical protein
VSVSGELGHIIAALGVARADCDAEGFERAALHIKRAIREARLARAAVDPRPAHVSRAAAKGKQAERMV